MSERRAEIIPFPARPGRPVPHVPQPMAADGQERLALALTKLDVAMREQRVAMGAWRASLAALKQSASSLEAGLGRYHEVLGTLGERVDGLGATERQLESWADGAEASALS